MTEEGSTLREPKVTSGGVGCRGRLLSVLSSSGLAEEMCRPSCLGTCGGGEGGASPTTGSTQGGSVSLGLGLCGPSPPSCAPGGPGLQGPPIHFQGRAKGPCLEAVPWSLAMMLALGVRGWRRSPN